ncbi:MAG TPA: S26 family signal peptidase, partial [Pirellulaceae bacterium]|nr:S26 family signal peptidase [Pirellulaceae bacterium]
CVADVTSKQGEIALLLVRSGAKYICRINLADGQATLSILDPSGQELFFDGKDDESAAEKRPVAKTSVKGPGSYRLRLSNCDHQVLLWVNGSVVEFDGPTTYPSDDLLEPATSEQDPGDLAPAGVGAGQGASATIRGLRIYRDKYYIATPGGYLAADYEQYPSEALISRILATLHDPAEWNNGILASRGKRDFKLQNDQFLPLGDNSPASYDSRYWPENYVERDLLIGKALLIYWPHTWNRPIPFTPNFRKMGPIR